MEAQQGGVTVEYLDDATYVYYDGPLPAEVRVSARSSVRLAEDGLHAMAADFRIVRAYVNCTALVSS